MTIGVWQPAKADAEKGLSLDDLKAYAVLTDGALENLATSLSAAQIGGDGRLMRLDEAPWQVATALSDEELVNLVRFFTLAERQLPGWDGGKQSPVIYLVRILKQREAFTPVLRQWVKANTDNRYLPNGALL
ncbi:MAG: hypothetical protein HQ497_12465 [SAR86 cluster bacterium]|jgi:hypothetical protein|uniref:Uncharacterized protein n=1 Tax=SAR86 cluster bacterium TaxID=2030880 RepID=A0A973AA53_9GAMM|nr:hypothetical protein [SAR86 cluster bacterium]|tara:strand:+ start:81 stop:476 length:396 start_codon:yes stop_codon:yes gene_type:complete